MKKKLLSIFALSCILACVFMGCTTKSSMAFTFKVDNGDQIEIKLDTIDGYSITSELPFAISLKDEVQTQGTFIQSSYYDEYANVAKTDANAKVIKEGELNGNKYIFWNYNNAEYNAAIMVKNSNTAVLIGNNVSQDSAEKILNRLTITKK